jgi:hypothetical protein
MVDPEAPPTAAAGDIRRSACIWRGLGGPKHYTGEQAKGGEITRKKSAA